MNATFRASRSSLAITSLAFYFLQTARASASWGRSLSLAGYSLSKLGNQVCGTTVYEVMHSGTLGLQGQAEFKDRIESQKFGLGTRIVERLKDRKTRRTVGGSVFPDQADETALHLDLVGPENAGFEGLVGGLQGNGSALAAQPF